MRFYRFIVLMIAVFFSVGRLQAQSTISGYVTGIVTDPSKGVVANAKVVIENAATSSRESATTGSDGTFHFKYVPPGNYTLTITADGFKTWRASIVVTVGQSTTANASLTIGSSVSKVIVSSETAPIQTENGDITKNYDEKQVQFVPNPGQDLTYIAQTSPGAVMNTQNGGGNFSVFGLPGCSNVFTINGMNYLNSYGDNNKSGATNNSPGRK